VLQEKLSEINAVTPVTPNKTPLANLERRINNLQDPKITL